MPLLFSYGTLQQDQVQQKTFGRRLEGVPDELLGYTLTEVKIDSASVVATSGKHFHPVAKLTGCTGHRVSGTVFEVTEQELQHSDQYEVDAYRRVLATLGSGNRAWVYVEAL